MRRAAASLLVSISLAHIFRMFMHVPMTNVTLCEKGLWPLGHSSSLLFCLGALPQHRLTVRVHHTTAPRHRKHGSYRTMRTLTSLLLVSGAAGLQLHKNIKLAAPALPAALLPTAVAAADSYEYGSA